jgi:ABC-type uncharacterized transport system permease subunit
MSDMKVPLPAPNEPGSAPRTANLRTALILLSTALVFFGGIIVSQYTGGNAVGIGVLGFAIIGFLLAAVGRNLRRKVRR